MKIIKGLPATTSEGQLDTSTLLTYPTRMIIKEGQPLVCIRSLTDTQKWTLPVSNETETHTYLIGDAPHPYSQHRAAIAWNDFSSDNGFGDAGANDRNQITLLTGDFIAQIPKEDFIQFGDCMSLGDSTNHYAGHSCTINGQHKIGMDVVAFMLSYGRGVKYSTLTTDVTLRYSSPTTTTNEDSRLDNSILGYVTDITDDYIEVHFKL